MTAVLKCEFKAYFQNLTGYVFLAVFYAFSALFFYLHNLRNNNANISDVFYSLTVIVILLVPTLTMCLFTEERKQKTDKLMLRSPMSDSRLVFGKFLASVLVFIIGLFVTLIFGVIVSAFTKPNWTSVLGNFIAMMLFGMALIAIGLFISSLAKSKMAACVATYAVAAFMLIADYLASFTITPWAAAALRAISFTHRLDNFSAGLFEMPSIIYFVSINALFVFLSVRTFGKRQG